MIVHSIEATISAMKTGLIKGLALPEGEGDNLVVFSISAHLKSGLIRGMTFGGSGRIRGGLLHCTTVGDIFLSQKESISSETPCKNYPLVLVKSDL